MSTHGLGMDVFKPRRRGKQLTAIIANELVLPKTVVNIIINLIVRIELIRTVREY
jgi:hypothetical protein